MHFRALKDLPRLCVPMLNREVSTALYLFVVDGMHANRPDIPPFWPLDDDEQISR